MAVSYDQRFEEWMATPPQGGERLIEGMYLYGNPFVGTLRFARGIYENVGLYPDENGTMRQWGQMNFELSLPSQRESLNLELTVTLDGLAPNTIGKFDRIPPEDLAKIMNIKLYSWIEPSAKDVPLIIPPPRFIVDEVTLVSNAVRLDCSGPLLPKYRAGKIYTVEEYPGLQVSA